MGRVQIAVQPWGVVTDRFGNSLASNVPTLTTSGGATATVYTDGTGTTPVSSLATDSDGRIPGYVEEGPYTLTINGVPYTVEAVSSRDAGVIDVCARPYICDPSASAATNGAALRSAVAAAAQTRATVTFGKPGTYPIDQELDLSDASGITLDMRGAKLDVQNVTHTATRSATYRGIVAYGATEATGTLLTNAARKHATEIRVASGSYTTADIGKWVYFQNQAPVGVVGNPDGSGAWGSGDPTIAATWDVGAALPDARGMLVCGSEKVGYDSYTQATVSGRTVLTFTVRSGAGLGRGARASTAAAHSANAVVCEYNPAKFWIWDVTCQPRGEIKRIWNVVDLGDGTTAVQFEQALYDDYSPTINSQILRITKMPSNITIRLGGGQIASKATLDTSRTEQGMFFYLCDNLTIEAVDAGYNSQSGIALHSCIRWKVQPGFTEGKPGVAGTDATQTHYALDIRGASQWGEFGSSHASRMYTLFTISGSGTANHSGYSGNFGPGIPRHITGTNVTFENSAHNSLNRHTGYEAHGAGEYITFSNFHAEASYLGLMNQCCHNFTAENGTLLHWRRAGVQIGPKARSVKNVRFSNINCGSPSKVGGVGLLAAPLSDGDTYIQLGAGQAALFQPEDGGRTTSIARIKSTAGDELVEWAGVSLATDRLTIMARNYMGSTHTAAAQHPTGTVVESFGEVSQYAVDCDFSQCTMGRRLHDQPTAALAADVVSTSASTVTVSAADAVALDAAFPGVSSTNTLLLEIEGNNQTADDDGGFTIYSEVVVCSAINTSTGVLTLLKRGAVGTVADTHLTGTFVIPFEWAVEKVVIDGVTVDNNIQRSAASIRGSVPTRECALTNFRATTKRPVVTTDTEVALDIYPHGWHVDDIETYGWAQVLKLRGNLQTFGEHIVGKLPYWDSNDRYGINILGDSTRGGGPGVRCDSQRGYDLFSTASNCEVYGGTFSNPNMVVTRVVVDAGTNNYFRNVRNPAIAVRSPNVRELQFGGQMNANDLYVPVTSTAAVRTVTLPAVSAVKDEEVRTVKDESGGAATHNITVVPSGSDTIDGGASVVLSANYGTVRVRPNVAKTGWSVV